MNPALSKRITMSSIRVWPDLANMPGVDAAPTPQAPNEEEEELEEPQMSACFAERDDVSEGSPAEMAEKATGSTDEPLAEEAGTEAMEAEEAAEAAEIPAGGSEAGEGEEKDEQVIPPSVSTTWSEDVRQGSSSEVPLGQPQPASEETPEEQATEAPEAEGTGEAAMAATEVEADKEEEKVGMEVEAEKDEEEWVNIPGAPQELTPAMPSDAEEEPEESIDDTLQLMLEISEQEPGTKQHVFADSVAEKPPVEEELPPKEAPSPQQKLLEAEPQAAKAAPAAQEVRSPARTPERKESPAPTVKPKSPGQSGAKRGRNEANPFYPPLRPPVESSPMVPRPPKRVKLPAVVMPHGKTQAPGTVLLRAVALVLEELFRQLQPSLLRQVPKIMERNRFTEIALLHQVLEKYVAPLPLLPEGDGSPSQIDLLQVILEKLPKGLGVPSGLLRGRKPVHIEVAEEAVKDFLQRLYALINSAQNQEASASAPEAQGAQNRPESASSSRKAPVQVDSQDSEDREAGAERRLSDRILHGDTLLSREQVERRIAWKRHYAMLEKMAQAAAWEPAEAPAAPVASAVPAASASRALRSSWGLQRQQIEMFE